MISSRSVLNEIDTTLKYEGFLKRQEEEIERFERLESKLIPTDFNYTAIASLSTEAREKLGQIRPASIGQASRISGVSPADISLLIVHLQKHAYLT